MLIQRKEYIKISSYFPSEDDIDNMTLSKCGIIILNLNLCLFLFHVSNAKVFFFTKKVVVHYCRKKL